MKIITPIIERLEKLKNWVQGGSAKKCLQQLLKDHPELDYAGELFEFVKELSKADIGAPRTQLAAQALIEKIKEGE